MSETGRTLTAVFVRGLEFYAYHGVSEEERRIGHRFKLDLEALVEESARDTDEIEGTVSYAALAEVALEVGMSDRCLTVERAAHKIGLALLRAFPRVERVRVRLSKRLPPMDLVAEEAGVEIEVGR